MELCQLTIHELQDKIRSGDTSPSAVLQSVFNRIDRLEADLNSYISVFRQEAFELAAIQDEQVRRGEIAPLTGIPIALKDILCTKGWKTTCGSRILDNFIPPYDATAVDKLRAAGAIFSGKTNMDEFGMGSSTETSFFGVTRNPWNLSRIPGGSSGGSAAAVAAAQCIASIGTDTGGSIRQPAALNGVVGLKPTYGRVSRYGMIAFASSLDQIGPITRDVEDCAIMMNVLAGHDAKDSTSAPREAPDYLSFLGKDITGWTIGIPKEYFIDGINQEVLATMDRAVATLEKIGARCVEVSLPHTPYCVSVYYIIAPAEASSNLARYDGVRFGYRSAKTPDLVSLYKNSRSEGFGNEVKRRIMIGTYALSSGYYDAYYKKASQVRRLISDDLTHAFESCDALLTPTTPTPAFGIGEKTADPIQMYLTDIFTITPNLAGIPAISVPAGYSREGLPMGIQFLTPAFEEGRLLQLAQAYEKAAAAGKMTPPGV